MDERGMTEAEMDLAQEVHAHNERAYARAEGFVLVAAHLGLPVPGEKDADGRWTYDASRIDAAIAQLDAAGVADMLAKVRFHSNMGIAGDLVSYEEGIVRRREELASDAFAAELEGLDDVAGIERLRNDMAEERDEIESYGPHWQQDGLNAVRHQGLADRMSLCDARIAEIAPAPGR